MKLRRASLASVASSAELYRTAFLELRYNATCRPICPARCLSVGQRFVWTARLPVPRVPIVSGLSRVFPNDQRIQGRNPDANITVRNIDDPVNDFPRMTLPLHTIRMDL